MGEDCREQDSGLHVCGCFLFEAVCCTTRGSLTRFGGRMHGAKRGGFERFRKRHSIWARCRNGEAGGTGGCLQTILGDPREALGGVDAALVEDRVDRVPEKLRNNLGRALRDGHAASRPLQEDLAPRIMWCMGGSLCSGLGGRASTLRVMVLRVA